LVFEAPGAGIAPPPGEATWATWASSAGLSGGTLASVDAPAGGGVPWPQGALPIGSGAAPIGIGRLSESVTSPVPEPASWLLGLAGGVALAAVVRRRRLLR